MEATYYVSRVLELGGLSVFIGFCFRGLQQQIAALKTTAEMQKETLSAQSQTLTAMDRRIQEEERIGALYRNLINELPKDVDNYKTLIRKLKDQVIEELQLALERKDEQVAALTRSRLDEIEKQEQVLDQLPALRKDLMETFQALEARLSVLDLFQPGTPLRGLLTQLEALVQTENHSRTFDTEAVGALPPTSRRHVRALTASLSSDKTEMVLTIQR